jgi:hypothetical protein
VSPRRPTAKTAVVAKTISLPEPVLFAVTDGCSLGVDGTVRRLGAEPGDPLNSEEVIFVLARDGD